MVAGLEQRLLDMEAAQLEKSFKVEEHDLLVAEHAKLKMELEKVLPEGLRGCDRTSKHFPFSDSLCWNDSFGTVIYWSAFYLPELMECTILVVASAYYTQIYLVVVLWR